MATGFYLVPLAVPDLVLEAAAEGHPRPLVEAGALCVVTSRQILLHLAAKWYGENIYMAHRQLLAGLPFVVGLCGCLRA